MKTKNGMVRGELILDSSKCPGCGRESMRFHTGDFPNGKSCDNPFYFCPCGEFQLALLYQEYDDAGNKISPRFRPSRGMIDLVKKEIDSEVRYYQRIKKREKLPSFWWQLHFADIIIGYLRRLKREVSRNAVVR